MLMKEAFEKLVKSVYQLRSENGCPWDQAQTLQSFKSYLLAEAQEVVQAIEKEDYTNLKEELGDLIWNILLITKIAEEENFFQLKEVLEHAREKLIKRHPWVWGDAELPKSAEEALAVWNKNKEKERR